MMALESLPVRYPLAAISSDISAEVLKYRSTGPNLSRCCTKQKPVTCKTGLSPPVRKSGCSVAAARRLSRLGGTILPEIPPCRASSKRCADASTGNRHSNTISRFMKMVVFTLKRIVLFKIVHCNRASSWKFNKKMHTRLQKCIWNCKKYVSLHPVRIKKGAHKPPFFVFKAGASRFLYSLPAGINTWKIVSLNKSQTGSKR